MKKVGIIGLGTITEYYLEGLKESSLLKLVAVCDTLNNPVSKQYYEEYTFYLDYKKMIEFEKLDYIIISTPPLSHFEIAKYALLNGVNVIIEKPAVTNIEDLNELFSLAKNNNLIFEIMYHWQNGSEVLKFNELYDTNKITNIKTQVLDPYSRDGQIIDDMKIKLLGSWIDSGVNILSMIKMWLPFNDYIIKKTEVEKCLNTGLPIMVDIDLVIDNVDVNINIDWRNHCNVKESYVIYEGRQIKIDHSNQCIIDQDNIIKVDDKIRLQRHYYNYFKNYKENVNYEASYYIHNLLFEVNKKL